MFNNNKNIVERTWQTAASGPAPPGVPISVTTVRAVNSVTSGEYAHSSLLRAGVDHCIDNRVMENSHETSSLPYGRRR